MIFTERSTRAFLFYIAIFLFFKFYILVIIWFTLGYCVFEDEDWFDEIVDQLTYNQGKYDNTDSTGEILLRRSKRKDHPEDLWKKFNF